MSGAIYAQRRMKKRNDGGGAGAAVAVSLEKKLQQSYCSYLDVRGCLSVAATCKAA